MKAARSQRFAGGRSAPAARDRRPLGHRGREQKQQRARHAEQHVGAAPSIERDALRGQRRAHDRAEANARDRNSERRVAPAHEPSADRSHHRRISAGDPYSDAKAIRQITQPQMIDRGSQHQAGSHDTLFQIIIGRGPIRWAIWPAAAPKRK